LRPVPAAGLNARHPTRHIRQQRKPREGIVPKTRIYSPGVAEPPPGRWSNAIQAGDFLFVSGQVSRSEDGKTIEGKDEYEQSRTIFTRILRLVEAAGGDAADVVKVTIYVVDIRKNTEVWRARQEFFAGDFPASTLVQVAALATPDILVEIEAVAHIPARR
jgi:2-iminobutanoate/2-iminopropanoate deaminase